MTLQHIFSFKTLFLNHFKRIPEFLFHISYICCLKIKIKTQRYTFKDVLKDCQSIQVSLVNQYSEYISKYDNNDKICEVFV